MIEYLAFTLLVLILTLFLFAIKRVQQSHPSDYNETSYLNDNVSSSGNNATYNIERGSDNDSNDTENEREVEDRSLRHRNREQLTRLQKKKQKKERERAERQRRAEEIANAQHRQRSHEDDDNNNNNNINDNNEKEDAAVALQRAEEEALAQLRAEKKEREEVEYVQWKEFIQVDETGEIGDEVRARHDNLVNYLISRANTVNEQASADLKTKEQHKDSIASLDETTHEFTSEHDSNKENKYISIHRDECNDQRELNSHKNLKQHASEQSCKMQECLLILQDVARSNNVTVDELVSTIEELVRQEVISGVFDDRGKFIFICPEHFYSICRCIRQRGRISVQELTRECNRIIFTS